MKHIQIFSDGGSRGNPGPAAYGFVVYEGDSLLVQRGEAIGISTNNIAEYSGVEQALRWVQEKINPQEIESVSVFVDSELIARQMAGIYKVKNETLKEYVRKIKILESRFQKPISYAHIPREKNLLADKLVNMALDNAH